MCFSLVRGGGLHPHHRRTAGVAAWGRGPIFCLDPVGTYVRMTKHAERAEARRLRREGLSLRVIARRLNVSIASVSVWVRDISRPVSASPPPPPSEEPDVAAFRQCSRCEELLPASAFNRRGNDRQWWCRECFRAYFRERGERHRDQVKTAKRRRHKEARAFVRRYLETNPCVDCAESDPEVLEFDHLRDKRAAVSWLRATATGCPAIGEEISKCDVVCANCHRRRTAKRAGWWRLNPDSDPPPTVLSNEARNMRHVFAVLRSSGCVDCGEQDLVVLEFDHVGPKRRNVVQLAYRGCSLRRLDEEIRMCEIRCANCHRRRHKSGRAPHPA